MSKKLLKNKKTFSTPKPPSNSQQTVMTPAIEKTMKVVKPTKYKLFLNKLLNKTWFKWEPYLYKYLNVFLARAQIEIYRTIRVVFWSLAVLAILTLIGYEYNLKNLVGCVGIVLILMLPIKNFIYKIKRIEVK